MKQMYKIKPVLQTMLCYGRKGGMGVPSDMHTETNMRESQDTKMNILTGIKMNTFSTPNRAKFLNNM